ncbi:MAG: GAP family protein [Gaiellaceae bacterium]
MPELFLLAVASALWPTLLAVDLIALRTPRPARILFFFLVGGLATCVGIGLVVVFALENSTAFTGSRSVADPVVYFTAGIVALVVGRVVSSHPNWVRRDRRKTRGPGWSERVIERGAALAFAAGVALNIIPGVFPIVGLKDIDQLDYSATATVALVVGFYLIMFVLIEVPLFAYLVAPARTATEVDRFNSWLRHNERRLAVAALYVAGTYLIVRGIVAAVD